MSEQKDNIKNGKNIDLDGVTVRNDLSVAEKVEEKKPEEEVKAVEADANASTETSVKDEIKPDVVVAPEAKEETSETPVSPAPSINVQEEQSAQVPPIPIDIDAISQQLGNESENPTSVDLNVSQVNNPTVQTPVQDFTTPSFDTPSMPDASVNLNEQNSSPIYETNVLNQDDSSSSNQYATTDSFDNSDKEFDDLLARYIRNNDSFQYKPRNTILPQSGEESDKIIDAFFAELPIDEAKKEIKKISKLYVYIQQVLLKPHLRKVAAEPLHREVQQENDKCLDILDAKVPIENLNENENQFSNLNSTMEKPYNSINYSENGNYGIPYTQQDNSDINQIYTPDQNVIKGDFRYNDTPEENNNFKIGA